MKDAKFDEILSKALEKYAQQEINSLEQDNGPIKTSIIHNARMSTLFEARMWAERHRFIKSCVKRVAIFLLALVMASGVSIFSVKAWRIRFLNYIIDLEQTHSKIDFGDQSGGVYNTDELTLEYIPASFSIEDKTIRDDYAYLKFKNGDLYFNIVIHEEHESIHIDTENADVKKVIINGQEGIYSTNDHINLLVFHDNLYSYSISGNIAEPELMKIAENIKNKKNE